MIARVDPRKVLTPEKTSDRLELLADVVELVRAGEFYMGEVGTKNHCRTVACMWGHAALAGICGLSAEWRYDQLLVNHNGARNDKPERRGALAFGITEAEALDLFWVWPRAGSSTDKDKAYHIARVRTLAAKYRAEGN